MKHLRHDIESEFKVQLFFNIFNNFWLDIFFIDCRYTTKYIYKEHRYKRGKIRKCENKKQGLNYKDKAQSAQNDP